MTDRAAEAGTGGADADIIVPLHSEDLSIDRRKIERTVRVRVQTINHEQIVDEALSRDQVTVERVPIGRTVLRAPPVRQEGDTTIIPVIEEVLVVERRLVLKEEIHLRRVQTIERHHETVVLRQQQAVIERVEPDATPAAGSRSDPASQSDVVS